MMKSATGNGAGAVLLCLAIAACTAGQDAPGQPPKAPVHFSCQGGQNIAVRFGTGSAVLETGDASVAMVQTRTADGFRYEGGGQAIRGKGNELRWHEGTGRTILCHAAPAEH